MKEEMKEEMTDKELECKLEYGLINAEECYHIFHRFPRRFDYLTDWERWVLGQAKANV